jgi:hypothetical protein
VSIARRKRNEPPFETVCTSPAMQPLSPRKYVSAVSRNDARVLSGAGMPFVARV